MLTRLYRISSANKRKALGTWFADFAETKRPEVLLTSSNTRALQTAEIVRAAEGCDVMRSALLTVWAKRIS